MHGSVTSAGTAAFAPLFAYISGSNRSRTRVAMTAPVVQEGARRREGERVAMTAPVVQEEVGARAGDEGHDAGSTGPRAFTVSFVLPAGLTAQTAPEPTDERVSLRTVPPSLAAATRYSGRWSASGYEQRRDRLLRAVRTAGLETLGAPRWLRFDPPFMPWFLRRNEVVVDVAEAPQTAYFRG